MNLIIKNFKIYIFIASITVFIGCKLESSNKSNLKNKLENNRLNKIIDSINCFDSNANAYHIQVLVNQVDLKSQHYEFCISEPQNTKICNSKILFNSEELGTISQDNQNFQLNCENSKIQIIQDFGGANILGHYFIEINLNNRINIDSIAVAQKVFLEDGIELISEGEKLNMLFTKKTSLRAKFNELERQLFNTINTTRIDNLTIRVQNKKFKLSNFDEKNIRAIQINTENVSKINDIAYYLQESGNNKEAIYLLEKIIAQFPNRVVAYLNLADAYWNTNQKEKAKAHYKKYYNVMHQQNKNLSKIPNRVKERM